MNLVLILFGFLTVVSALQQDKYKLPQEALEEVYKIGNLCAAEHGVDPALIPKLPDGTLPRDEATDKFVHCYAVKSGITNEFGDILIDNFAATIGNHPRLEEVKKALAKCNNETPKEDPIQTVVHRNKCYAQNSPVLLEY